MLSSFLEKKMNFKLIMENWRKFVNEQDAQQKIQSLPDDEEIESLPIDNASDPGPIDADEPEVEPKYLDPGLNADGVPNMLKRPPKHSIVIGDLNGKGEKGKPRGIFINGEFLGESQQWILGKNSDNFYKRDKNYRLTKTPNPTYRQTHYGTTELIRAIKSAIEEVNSISSDIYAARFAKMLLGKTDSDISPTEMKYGKALMGLGIYPSSTQKLYIEDLGLAPFYTDMFNNTYHGGQRVRGHSSHRTGRDADLGFYMLPGNEMVTRFPKNEISRSEWGFDDIPSDEAKPLGKITLQRGGLGPRKSYLKKKKPILEKQFLDALVEAYDPTSEDGYSERYKKDFDFQAGIEKVKEFLKQERIVTRKARRRDREKNRIRKDLKFIESQMGTIDMERTWVLIRSLFKNSDVKKCIIDEHLHLALRQACKRWGDKWPSGNRIFHYQKHKNHIHLNVSADTSEALGKKLAPKLRDAWQRWNTVKGAVKEKSEEKQTWLEDFYSDQGFYIATYPLFDYKSDEWPWNRGMGASGVYDELMKIIEPRRYAEVYDLFNLWSNGSDVEMDSELKKLDKTLKTKDSK